MSNPNPFPRFALDSVFDARGWSGDLVLELGEDEISIPTYDIDDNEGVYLSNIQFLNGYGSAPANRDFQNELKDGWDLAGGNPLDVSAEINANDKFAIYNLSGGDRLRLLASPDNRFWGFNVNGQTETGSQLIAPNDWLREVIKNGDDETPPFMTFERIDFFDDVLGTFQIPGEGSTGWIQSPVVHMRRRVNEGDSLDLLVANQTFEDRIAIELSAGARRVRVAVVDGYVVVTTPLAVQLAPDWVDHDFRKRLGYSGTEEPFPTGAGDNDIWIWRADNRLPGFINPERCLMVNDPQHAELSSSVMLTDGSYTSAKIGSFFSWFLEFRLQGPATTNDEHIHWMRKCLPLMTIGGPVMFHQDFGDFRIRMFDYEVGEDNPAYSDQRTSEENGYHGIILGRVSGEQSENQRVTWMNEIRQFFDVNFILSEREQTGTTWSGPPNEYLFIE